MQALSLCLSTSPIASPGTNEQLIEFVPDATFVCRNKEERCGYSMFAAGDVNRDGFDDFMVAAYHNYLHGWNSGGIYLITGGLNKNWGFNVDIETAATAIFRGSIEYDMAGYSVAGKGDFNGDGYDDMIIGAPGTWDRTPETPGWTYLIFGKKELDWGADCQLASSAEVKIEGEKPLDQLGYANSFVGDINHDGFDDLITSAPFSNQHKKWDGKAYLVLGSATGWHETDAIDKKAAASFCYPLAEALTGYSVAGVGDVNNDGTPDFVIGVPGANVACLILGRKAVDWGHNFNLENADYKFWGEFEGDYAGSWISAANDVNHDGYPDFLISAIKSYFEGGRIYLILGRDRWVSQNISLMQADASFRGEDQETHTGFCTSGLRDYDGDGFDDFLIGARYLNGPCPHSGKLYLIKGKASGWEHDAPLERVPDYFWGPDTITCAGWQVADIGDVNGDNAHDFATSGPFNSTAARWGGKIFLFYGKNSLYSIRGKVEYHAHARAVPGAKLVLDGFEKDSTITSQDGSYQLLLLPGRNYTITPSKYFASPQEKTAVSAYDAALVARHAVRVDTLNNPFSQLAADVDQDKKICMFDAAQICRFAVNLPRLAGSHVGEFSFEPKKRSYENSNASFQNENFTCVALGDVDGNWQGNLLAKSASLNSFSILPEKIIGYLDAPMIIPLHVADQPGVLSADIHVEYEPKQLELVAINKTGLSQDFDLIYNKCSDGVIKIAMYSVMPAYWNGDFLVLEFKAIRSTRKNGSDFKVTFFRMNDSEPSSDRANVIIIDKRNRTQEVDLRNEPNPFNPTTKIYFQTITSGLGQLKIYDLLGREVRGFELGVLEPGKHELCWDGKDNDGIDLASGVYIIKFLCDQDIRISKMIKLK